MPISESPIDVVAAALAAAAFADAAQLRLCRRPARKVVCLGVVIQHVLVGEQDSGIVHVEHAEPAERSVRGGVRGDGDAGAERPVSSTSPLGAADARTVLSGRV